MHDSLRDAADQRIQMDGLQILKFCWNPSPCNNISKPCSQIFQYVGTDPRASTSKCCFDCTSLSQNTLQWNINRGRSKSELSVYWTSPGIQLDHSRALSSLLPFIKLFCPPNSVIITCTDSKRRCDSCDYVVGGKRPGTGSGLKYSITPQHANLVW